MWCCSEIVILCPEIADLDQVELVVESKWFTRFSGNSIAQATECETHTCQAQNMVYDKKNDGIWVMVIHPTGNPSIGITTYKKNTTL